MEGGGGFWKFSTNLFITGHTRLCTFKNIFADPSFLWGLAVCKKPLTLGILMIRKYSPDLELSTDVGYTEKYWAIKAFV